MAVGQRPEEEVCSQELKEARSILNFCREQGRFPDLPGRDPTGGPSPTPSQRSNAASLVGDNLATSLASTADAGCVPSPTRLACWLVMLHRTPACSSCFWVCFVSSVAAL